MGFFIVVTRGFITSIIIFLSLSLPQMHAAQGARVDSTASADSLPTPRREFSYPEVLITATRLLQTASLSASPITVLDQEEIQRTNASSLADLLVVVPGLFVKDYGATSGLKTIAQRGLGPEHTLMLVNGMRVSNPQNSLLDLGLTAADEIDRIEVIHGGSSAAFGADAVAGVVNIVTSTGSDAFRASVGRGSFGYDEVQLSGATHLSTVAIQAAFREEKGDEDFPFVFRNGPQQFEMTRQNSDFIARTGSLQSAVTWDSDLQLGVYGRTFESERGVGGLVVGPASSSVARQFDKDNLLQIQFRGKSSSALEYRTGFQFHHNYQRYEDRNFFVGASSLNNYYKNIEWRIEPGFRYDLGTGTRLAVGGDFARTLAEGNSLARNVQRNTYGVYTSLEQKVGSEGDVVSGILLYPAIRFDAATTGSTAISNWSPQLGVVVPFVEVNGIKPTVRVNVSRNFAVPTFNMLFYAGGGGLGNPNLQPEYSTSFDIGMNGDALWWGRHLLQVSYFNITMTDRVVWVAAGGPNVTPKNIRSVRSTGVEVSYRWEPVEDFLSVSANYSSSSTKKSAEDFPGDRNVNTQLIYVPQETAMLSASVSQTFENSFLTQVAGTVATSFVGFRYTTEDNLNFLPSYMTVNCNVRARVAISPVRCVVRFDVNNLFDKEYQTIVSYPMPGRSYKFTLGLEY